jgi:phosphatidylserine/phosphatidylglycerophosphate/cardiolipin synthase-like enzyme
LDDIHPNLVVCNINCRVAIEYLLSNAKKSILIQTQYIVDENIFDILKNKSLELDDMRFIVSDTESNDFLVEYFGP